MSRLEHSDNSTNKNFKVINQSDDQIETFKHPVLEIILWKNPLKTVAILLSCLTLEISLICFSVISVLAYAGLTFLIVSTSFRLYLKFSGQFESNFIKSYLDRSIKVNAEKSTAFTESFIAKVDEFVLKFRSLLLIEDYFESLKLAVFLYFMTYIGAKFNFMTLCILVTLVVFSLPKIYQTYQVELDNLYRLLTKKVLTALSKLVDKIRNLPVLAVIFRQHREWSKPMNNTQHLVKINRNRSFTILFVYFHCISLSVPFIYGFAFY